MIAIKDKFPKLTPEEYFVWEEKQLLRHEYLNGELYAMSGGTQNHGRIASILNTVGIWTFVEKPVGKSVNCKSKIFGWAEVAQIQ